MKRHDLYIQGQGCSTTSLSFGKDRKVEFPDYFFVMDVISLKMLLKMEQNVQKAWCFVDLDVIKTYLHS